MIDAKIHRDLRDINILQWLQIKSSLSLIINNVHNFAYVHTNNK